MSTTSKGIQNLTLMYSLLSGLLSSSLSCPLVSSPGSAQSSLWTLKTLQWLPVSKWKAKSLFAKPCLVSFSADSDLNSLSTTQLWPHWPAPPTLHCSSPTPYPQPSGQAPAWVLPFGSVRNSLPHISTVLAPLLPSDLSQMPPHWERPLIPSSSVLPLLPTICLHRICQHWEKHRAFFPYKKEKSSRARLCSVCWYPSV